MMQHGKACPKGSTAAAHVLEINAARFRRTRDLLPETTEERKRAEVRWGLVNRVRAELAAGMYETEERWAAALERLLDDAEGR